VDNGGGVRAAAGRGGGHHWLICETSICHVSDSIVTWDLHLSTGMWIHYLHDFFFKNTTFTTLKCNLVGVCQ
jgi:hypothetical protein